MMCTATAQATAVFSLNTLHLRLLYMLCMCRSMGRRLQQQTLTWWTT
jgi:hypothetical protein